MFLGISLAMTLRGVALADTCPVHFLPPAKYSAGSLPRSVVIGDFNEDGAADLAVANRDSADVTIFSGDGQGGFLSPPASFPAGSNPARLVAGDFNGDGHLDLAVANDASPGALSILFGDGRGSFSPPVTHPVGSYPYSVFAGDFNGDGRADLAVSDQCTGDVTVLLATGNGNFTPGTSYAGGPTPEAVASGDFDGDGYADLAVADFYGTSVTILLGNGDGTFRPGASLSAGASSVSIAVADFNLDGKADIAVANRDDNTVSIFLGNGDGSFAPASAYPAGSQPMFVAAADLNGDGWVDLAVANQGSGDVSILAGKGDGTFQAPASFASGFGASALAIFDFNRDGRPDLAVTNTSDGNVSVFLNDTFNLALSPAALPRGTVGVGYTQILQGFGGAPPYSFAVASGALPAGLSLDGSSGLLTGTPSGAGTASFAVTLTDSRGCTVVRDYALTISCAPILVTPPLLPPGVTGVPYFQACGAGGGSGSCTFSVAAGTLPAGLSVNAAGVLSGTPASSGLYDFSIKATDASGCYGTRAYPLAVSTVAGPTVTAASPVCLGAAGGEPVTISGTNFIQGATVAIAGQPAVGVTVGNPIQITAMTPPAPPGTTGSVIVTNPDGQSGTLLNAVLFDFTDVPASNPFHSFVCGMARNQITAGCGSEDFCPGSPVLRSSMAVLLLRASHGAVYVPPPASGFFDDLPASNPFAPWVEEVYNEGIAAGCAASPLRYCPSSPVSRAAMAVFLLRALWGVGYTPPPATGIFADVPAGSPFAPWIEQIYALGITGGCTLSPLNYCPADPVTRASMAVFLTATFGLP